MKSSILFATAAIAASVVPAAPAAAVPTSQAQQFASCAVNKYDGAELLATQPGSEEEAGVLQEFTERGCSASPGSATLLRGALAEMLFQKDFGVVGARPRREIIEVFRVEPSELDAMAPGVRRRVDMIGFASCAAASNIVKTAVLLKTAPGSVEEAAIVKQMEPSFAPCMLEGERLEMGRAELRGALAEGTYRLALAQNLDEEVVVTGTRDAARKIECRSQETAGTRIHRNVCLTEAQWLVRDRDEEYLAEDFTWRTMEEEEQATTIARLIRDASMSGGGS
jgi:hypothetical protein